MITLPRLSETQDYALELSTSRCRKWTEDALSYVSESSYDLSSLLPKAKELAQRHLPNFLRKKISQINKVGGLTYLHLKGFPIDPEVPSIPSTERRFVSKTTLVSEIVLLGIISDALKAEPFSYLEQKQGDLIQNIFPIKELAQTQSNASSGKFGWHSDDALFLRSFRAEGIILYCLRNQETATFYAPVDEIITTMNPLDVQVLYQPRFRVRTPESFNTLYGGKVIYSEPRPILTYTGSGTEIALATYNVQPTDPQDEEAATALTALKLALRPPVAKAFVLKPGNILILSNTRGLHARGPITDARWLQRCYFRKNLESLRQVTGSSRSCRVFQSSKLFLL